MIEWYGLCSHLCNIRRNDGRLGEYVKYDDQPLWEVLATIFSQVEASHASQPDA